MLTPQEVSERAFPKASFGGYNMAQVDEFLDVLTEDYSALYSENAVLKSKMKVLVEKVEEYRSTEEAMRKALMAAQRMADDLVKEAEQKRAQILEEAEAEAGRKVEAIRQEEEAERFRLESAQKETASYVAQVRALHAKAAEYLDQLDQLTPTPSPAENQEEKVEETVSDIDDSVQRLVAQAMAEAAAENEKARQAEAAQDITVASEIMAVLCLATSLMDLKQKLGSIIVAYTYDGKPVTAHDLKAEGAMTALLKDALKPNLVQTLEGTPAFIHGGPFANIAHGCNSIMATRMALKLGDYVVTEAGFAADLGAEKFLDIKCRMAGLTPAAVVVVATVRALKYHGGVPKAELNQENLEALEKGLPNLLQHVGNIKNVYGLPCVVAINAFSTDTKAELDLVEAKCRELGVNVALSEVWAKGGEGGRALAQEVVRLCEEENHFQYAYDTQLPIEEKLEAIVKKIYHGDGVVLTPAAKKQVKQLTDLGFGGLPICMAKTQYSFSDDPGLLGAPQGFTVTVRNVKVSAGAGFLVALTGDIMTMPGLPKVPSAEKIDVDENGRITGLF